MTELLAVVSIVLMLAVIILLLKVKKSTESNPVNDKLAQLDNNLSKVGSAIADDFQRNREESSKLSRENREELAASLKSFEEKFTASVAEFNQLQRQKFNDLATRQEDMSRNSEMRLEKMRETVEKKLESLQQDNNAKLEKMRETVDEKLHKTLEHRLGESFKLVSERLEKVQKGLGEMQSLANGVGDLKKVLTNVKTRGMMGEYQLENILEQMLTPEQYAKNVKTNPHSNAFVEFAIKLPGRKDDDKTVWLPVDSKFPIENYQLLQAAYEDGDTIAIEARRKGLVSSIRLFAKDINSKYISPPHTTDFAILFLPIEGLYAEVLREPGLLEVLQREFRIVITGPTTLSALLNSLQMGFRTLAIEKRSSEVWEILGAVKTEFGKFGDILEKTKKKLEDAGNVIDKASVRSRAIERKLRKVQELPVSRSNTLLDESSVEIDEDTETITNKDLE